MSDTATTAGRHSGTRSTISLHMLGVFCGLSAAVWLGSAEAPTKLVNEGFSPFLISMGMVMGAFVARWTIPTLLKGTAFVFVDLKEKPHLMVWALVGGMLWAVANTLTIFAVRNVGLAIAFPLWNTNSLVGLFWGCLLFKELRGSRTKDWAKVIGGAAAIVFGAAVLAIATAQQNAGTPGKAAIGIIAALGAGVLLGTMYIPYRKAYISGMNPLSFVTIFTFGELATVLVLGLVFYGGARPLAAELERARPMLFWPFVGGFCWVIGDLFQQYAAKYIGIGRGIPLSNTNQLWGLAWGALVFGEFAGLTAGGKLTILVGSTIMIAGAVSISMAAPPPSEMQNWNAAMHRECDRYGLNKESVAAVVAGNDPLADNKHPRRWWEILIVCAASGIFVWLAVGTRAQRIPVNLPWMIILIVGTLIPLGLCGSLLWRRTRFS
ncbi:MAG TPA: GRP family sugar transporter [Terracidiphilus sp.]|nr:GRP family sugar transporter [Terracidiphilus sp.]